MSTKSHATAKAKKLVGAYKSSTKTAPKSPSPAPAKKRTRKVANIGKILTAIFMIAILIVGIVLSIGFIKKNGFNPISVAKEKFATVYAETMNTTSSGASTEAMAEASFISTNTTVDETYAAPTSAEKPEFLVVKKHDQKGLTPDQSMAVNSTDLPVNFYDVHKIGGSQTVVVCVSSGPVEVIRNTTSGCEYPKAAFGIKITDITLSETEWERVQDEVNSFYAREFDSKEGLSSKDVLQLANSASDEYKAMHNGIAKQLDVERNFGISLVY